MDCCRTGGSGGETEGRGEWEKVPNNLSNTQTHIQNVHTLTQSKPNDKRVTFDSP